MGQQLRAVGVTRTRNDAATMISGNNDLGPGLLRLQKKIWVLRHVVQFNTVTSRARCSLGFAFLSARRYLQHVHYPEMLYTI